MKEETTIYTMEQWDKDGTFEAIPGQQITREVYEKMRTVISPLELPADIADYALEQLNIPVHSGFLMGNSVNLDSEGNQLYLAFGMNDYGKGLKYFFLGKSRKEKLMPDGIYYFFDSLGIMYSRHETGLLYDNLVQTSTFKDDKAAIREAINYESELFRYEYKGGKIANEECLYEPLYC